ncbi:MAG: FeoB small GTPase domain-containing protein, partial [Planctomycetota bacterium]
MDATHATSSTSPLNLSTNASAADASDASTTAVASHPEAGPQGRSSGRSPSAGPPRVARVVLVGNPNTGKTTIFNRLCGVRAKTANFPGVTVEAKLGRLSTGSGRSADEDTDADAEVERANGEASAAPGVDVVDLPGVYRLGLDVPESVACRNVLSGADTTVGGRPDAAVIVLDASNLARNLPLVLEVKRFGLPVLVALNMVDIAQRRGLSIDTERLASMLGCPVIPTNARSGEGIATL